MKRFLLLFSLITLLFLLLFTLLAVNLEYLVNRTFVKDKIRNLIAERASLDINYTKVDINLYRLLFSFEGLEIKGKDFELYLPKGKADFDWQKILTFNFFPKKLQLKNPQLKVFWSEEPSTFKPEDLKRFIKKISHLELLIKNATIDYEFSKKNSLRFSLERLTFSNREPQVLMEAKVKSSAFSSLLLNLRYNYREEFLESSIKVKNFDLARIKIRDLEFLSKTNFDLDLELSLEKGVMNAGFTGSAPCIAFKKGEKPLVCGIFQGTFVGTLDNFELHLSPIDLKYPEIKGDLLFTKERDYFKLLGNLEDLRWEDVRELLSPHLPEELSQEIFGRVRGGYFHDIAFITEGRELTHLLRPENIQITGMVEDGEVYLPEKDFTFTSLEGSIAFKDKNLHFAGKGRLEEVITLNAREFSLDLLNAKKKLSLICDFAGEAPHLQRLALSQIEELKFMKDWEVKGGLMGSVSLAGPLEALSVKVSLKPEALQIKFPHLKNWVTWQGGKLTYEEKRLLAEDFQIIYEESYLNKGHAEFYLDTHYLILKGEEIDLKEGLLHELIRDSEDIIALFERHKISLSSVSLEEISFEGFLPKKMEDLDKSYFLEQLKVRGKVLDFSASPPYQGKTYTFTSQEIPFEFREGLFSLKPSKIIHGDTLFEIKGNTDLSFNQLFFKGKGRVGEETLREIQDLVGLSGSPLALRKIPLEIEDFSLDLKGDHWDFRGKGVVEDLTIYVSLENRDDLKIESEVNSEVTAFKLNLRNGDPLFLEYHGNIDFQELSRALEDPPITKGKMEGNFTLHLSIEKLMALREIWEREDPKSLLREYLAYSPLKFYGEASFREVNFKTSAPLILSGDFLFQGDALQGKDLSLRANNSNLTGNIALWREGSFLRLEGDLVLQDLNLKELTKEAQENKTREEPLLEKIFQLPLKGDLAFRLERLTLPTSHLITNSTGKLSIEEQKLLRLEFPEIEFCGIKFSAELEKNPQFQYFFADLPPSKGELLDLFSCLYPEEMPRTILEGPFKIEGFFYTDGEKDFFQHSYGKLEISSDRGYLYRAPLIARVLAFLSPIDLFRGKIPNLENNLLPYEELQFKGEFHNSNLYLDTLFMSAPGFRLFGSGPVSLATKDVSLTFLVSPFKTLDVILEYIPYINKWILGKERMFIYLPLEVTGKYDQPNIVPLHPASIGKGLFRFIFKFFGIQEEFFKRPQSFEDFRKRELFQRKSGNSLHR